MKIPLNLIQSAITTAQAWDWPVYIGIQYPMTADHVASELMVFRDRPSITIAVVWPDGLLDITAECELGD